MLQNNEVGARLTIVETLLSHGIRMSSMDLYNSFRESVKDACLRTTFQRQARPCRWRQKIVYKCSKSFNTK